MELSASELSIYDKLSETIDLVRQTGYQCGMPEKAIERFIRQLLEKNEPQRGPPRYPLLVVLYKGLITLGLVLLTAYFMIQPYTLSPPETTLTKAHAWGSLISHIRLLPLPITKKYMLEKCQDWWSQDCRRNVSLITNCSCSCSMKNLRAVADLEQLSENLLQSQPLIIKTGQYRSYDEMKHFQSLYPDLINFVVHEDSAGARSSCSGQGLLFHFFRKKPPNKSQIIEEIFPIFSSLGFPNSVSLESCFLIHQTKLQDKEDSCSDCFLGLLFCMYHYASFLVAVKFQTNGWWQSIPMSFSPWIKSVTYRLQSTFVVGSGRLTLNAAPSSLCRQQCQMLVVELEAGDVGFANMEYWTTSFNSVGSEPTVVCDGSAS